MMDAFKVYNTYTRKEEEIKPLTEGVISMYTCGPTVYNYAHVGNYKAYVFEDVLEKALIQYGYRVNRVMNITDVGHLTSDEDEGADKLEVGAKREGITAWEVAQKYTDAFISDLNALSLKIPERLIKATGAISEQIAFVQELEKKGFTYLTEDGVYFDSTKLSDYGYLARLDLEGQRAGARVEMREGKRSQTDFALWKFSPKNEKRDMEWESPWGVGFPGWHLECSAIILKELGEQIDIHTGGTDHIPVHHVNEIAQTEALTGKLLANIWMHAGFLQIDGGKMSKSLGNVYLISDFIERGYNLMALKLFYYGASYRSLLNFTWEGLEASQKRYYRWLSQVAEIQADSIELSDQKSDRLEGYLKQYQHFMYFDDLNLPAVLALIEDVLSSDLASHEKLWFIKMADEVLSLNLLSAKNESQVVEISGEAEALIAQRKTARENGDWAEADLLRDKLAELGYQILDTKDGQKVEIKRK